MSQDIPVQADQSGLSDEEKKARWQLQAVEGPIDPLGNIRFGPDWSGKELYFGTDWRHRPPNDVPLFEYEYNYLRSNILSNVNFIELLGEGAFGKVWKVTAYVHEPEWRRLKLACKIIRHEDFKEETILDSINELRILRYLRHENICNFIDIIGIPDRGTHFVYSAVVLFFELCDGRIDLLIDNITKAQTKNVSATDYIFPERLSRHWFAQIARAIEYLHSNGVVHRDIHFPNILFCRSDVVHENDEDNFLATVFKLADFGISREIDLTPDVYQWTETKHRSTENRDISQLYRLLFNTGVSGIKNLILWDRFFDYCKTGEWKNSYPKVWLQLSSAMKDLLWKLESSMKRTMIPQITAKQILLHPWLQLNDEPQTERFILREH